MIHVPVFAMMICVKSLVLIKKFLHLLSNVVDFYYDVGLLYFYFVGKKGYFLLRSSVARG